MITITLPKGLARAGQAIVAVILAVGAVIAAAPPAAFAGTSTTTTTISCSPNPADPGQVFTCTAAVSPASATGVVYFSMGVPYPDGIWDYEMLPGSSSNQVTSTPGSLTASGPIYAHYAPNDPTYNSSDSVAYTEVVLSPPTPTATSTPAATATPAPTPTPTSVSTLTFVGSSPNPSTYGDLVTFTARVSSSGGTPDGNVTFNVDGSNVSTLPLDQSGTAAYSTSSLSAGYHNVSASYAGSGIFLPSTSMTGQTVNKATPTINWSNPANITYGTLLSGTQLGANTSVGGSFSYLPVSGTALNAGNGQPLSVTFYPSDSADYNTASDTVYINVNRAPLTITADNQSKTYGGMSTFAGTEFTTTLMPYGDSIDSVTLTSAGAISTAVASTYPIVPSDAVPAAGTSLSNYDITYDNGTLTVDKAGTTASVVVQPFSIDVDEDQDSSVYGYPVEFTATVSANSPVPTLPTSVVTLTFDSSTVVTGILADGEVVVPYAWLTASDTVSHTVDVAYGGDQNFLTSDNTLAGGLMVDQDSTHVHVSSSANPSVYGQSVTLTARVSADSPGGGTPTGTATFFVDDSSVTSSLVDGVATYTTSTLAIGTHPVQVNYSGDGNFFASNSQLVGGQTVKQDTTSVGISSSANPSTYGQPITLTATVSADAPGSGTPTGTVTFTIDNSTVATSSLVDGVASYATSTLTAVSHPVTVTYSGDSNFINSTGSASQVVNRANPVITWANPAAISYGTPLSGTQLDARGSVPGAFTYDPLAGTVLGAGAGQTLTVTLVPSDTLNYNTVTQTASITVTQVPLTITADSKSMTYGGVAPSLTYTATGFVNGDSVASLSVAPTLSTVPFTSVVGSYPITPSAAVDPNYAFSYVEGTLSIGPAPLTITATNQSKTYGATADLGSTAFTSSGLLFEDAVSSVTLTSTGAISAAVAGPYDIVPSSALGTGLNNYDITYDTGTLTVDQAGTTASVVVQPFSSSVDPDWDSSVYGYPVVFTATVTAASPVPAPPTGVVTFTFGAPMIVRPVGVTSVPIGNSSTATVTGTLSNGVATGVYAWMDASTAPHSVSVDYGGDQNFLTSTNTLAGGVAVDQDGTNVVVSSSTNPSFMGQTVVLTVTVNANAPGGGTPTGTVVFDVDGSPSTRFLADGIATYTMTAPAIGTHSVSVDYSGDSNFIFSSGSLSGGQVVTKANPVITWTNPSDIVYGTALSGTQLDASGSVSGTLTYSLAAGAYLGAGDSQPLTVTLVPSDTADYNTVSQTAYITVTTAPLTVTADSASRAYGAANPTFTGTVSGVTAGDTITASYSTTSTVTSPVGTYAVTPTLNDPGNRLGNYDVTSNNGTLTVTVAPGLIVTPTDRSKVYGTALSPSDFTGTISGILNGDDITAAYDSPVGDAATAPVAGSPYTITASLHDPDGKLGNYAATTSNTGSLTVDKATTRTSLASSPNPSVYGEMVTLTATVAAGPICGAPAPKCAPTPTGLVGAGAPSGTVHFYSGLIDLGTVTFTSGVAVTSTAGLPVGADPITADYSGDSNFITSTRSLTQTVAGVPDLRDSTESVSAATVAPGSTLTYTIVLSNSGSAPAAGARVTDTLPAGLTYISSSANSGSPVFAGGLITWTGNVGLNGPSAPSTGQAVPDPRVWRGGPVTLTILVGVDSPQANGTIITNTASIDDGNGVVTSKSAAVTIASAPDLSGSTVSASAVNVGKGDLMTYTIDLTNTGTADATAASIADALPAQLTFVSASASGGASPSYSGGSVNWSGAVSVGTPVRVTIGATVSQNAANNSPITNTVTIDDGGGNSTSKSATVWVLPPPVSGDVYPVGGGTITGTLSATGGTTATVSFPTGAVTDTVTVVFTPTLSCPAGSLKVLDNCFLLQAHDSSGDIIKHFDEAYTITIHYTAAEVANLNEDSLKIYYYDVASGQWEALPTTVDKVNQTLTATVDHMTEFTVMGNVEYHVRLLVIYKNYPSDKALEVGQRASPDGRPFTIRSLLGSAWLELSAAMRW